MGFVARQEECFLTSAFVYHQPSLGFQLRKYLWSFPNWLGSSQRGHRHQLTARRSAGLAPGPSSCTGVKPGFFSLIEWLGVKFGACLGCGAGASWEQWAWRVESWFSWGSLRLLPPAPLRRAWRNALARGLGLPVSCKMMLMPQHLKMRKKCK